MKFPISTQSARAGREEGERITGERETSRRTLLFSAGGGVITLDFLILAQAGLWDCLAEPP